MTAPAQIIRFVPGFGGELEPDASPLSGALFMIGRGYRVLRLAPGTKAPYAAGINEATSDPELVKRWHQSEPSLNFGVAMGGGHVGIDCDMYKPGGPEDRAGLGEIPPTLRTSTPQGGEHIYLTVDGDVSQSNLAPTIDVRSAGGYLVCPGSKINGKRYTILEYAPAAPCSGRIKARFGGTDPCGPAGEPANWMAGTSGDWRARISDKLREKIRREGEDRSAHSFNVMADLFALGLTDDDVRDCATDDDAAFALKFADRGDLESEIGRARLVWRRKNPDPATVHSPIVPPVVKIEQSPKAVAGHGFRWVYDKADRGVDWLVDDAIMLRGWGFLSALTTYGKTFVVTYLAMCLASGRAFFGRKILHRGGTCIVAAEAAYATPHRVAAAVKHGFQDVERPPIVYEGAPPNLLQPAVLEHFIERLRQLNTEMLALHGMPLRFVAFDTFAKSFGLNEDKAHESVLAHNAMERIAEALDVAVIAVGHFGKDPTKGTRGSSAHEANAHFVVTIPKRGKLWLKKTKEAPSDVPMGNFELATVDLGQDPRGKLITSLAVNELGPTSAFQPVEHPDSSTADPQDTHSASTLKAAISQALREHGQDIPHPDKGTVRAVSDRHVRNTFISLWGGTWNAGRVAFGRANVQADVQSFDVGGKRWFC